MVGPEIFFLSLFFLYFISFLWTAGLIQINDDDDDDDRERLGREESRGGEGWAMGWEHCEFDLELTNILKI